MIPRTFPSSRASNGSTQMIVYFLGSVTGLTRWIDYIPVKYSTEITASKENTYDQNGYIPVIELSSITGATPFKEYVPVYLDNSSIDEDVWKTKSTGFIPIGTAGAGGASLNLDFTAGILDSRVTFTRSTTGTRTNSLGLIETVAINTPRFDYDPVTLAPKGLLIEEQRTNLLTYSEQFDNAAWSKVAATIAANAVVSPDGSITGDQIVEDTTLSFHGVFQNFSATNGTAYTVTIYAKAAGRTVIQGIPSISHLSTPTAGYVNFDLSNGTVTATGGSVTASITSVGNGWYRCSLSFTAQATSTSAFGWYAQNSPTAGRGQNYTGNGTSGVYIWGAQIEAGAFATSYIPTVASQVTRTADSASMIGNNFARWYNQTEGTMYAGFDVAATTSGGGMSIVSIATASTNGYLLYKGLNAAGLFAYTDGTGSASLGNLSVNVLAKAAIAYNGVSNAGVLNGASPASITPVAVTPPTQMYVGRSYSGTPLTGHIARIAFYPRRLSNSELQSITS